jgi:hypothetical protein
MRLLRRPLRHTRLLILELVTISTGLLIALAIDSLVEWRQQRQLAERAANSLRVEIQKNAAALDQALPQLEQIRQLTTDSLAAIGAYLRQGAESPSRGLSLNLKVTGFDQADTSWKSAQATRAVDFMPYEQVEAYSTIYSGQADLLAEQRILLEDFVQTVALAKRFNLDTKPRLTPEQAALLTERFSTWQLHATFLYTKARIVSKLQHAFLEGKPITQVGFKENFDGMEISADE